nr:hypothetical protein [Tanacetum cinerariifolium]
MDNDKPKIGFPTFMTEDDDEPWNGGTNGSDTNFVNETSNFISQMNETPYDFTLGSSLVRIMRNGFNQHEEMSGGAWLTNDSNLEIFYEGPKTSHY